MALIYNEGRVAGYSAYETYVKQFLLVNPEGTPATEREWLASSLAMGSSLVITVPKSITTVTMLSDIPANGGIIDILRNNVLMDIYIDNLSQTRLENLIFRAKNQTGSDYTAAQILEDSSEAISYLNKFPEIEIQNNNSTYIQSGTISLGFTNIGDNDYHHIDIPLPTGTNLRAANTIYGTYTDIELESDSKVSVYSDTLIPNNSTINPVGNVASAHVIADTLPTNLSGYSGLNNKKLLEISNYLKIEDGVMLQSGDWVRASQADTPPECGFEPTLSEISIVRLLVKGPITSQFNILLTGFTDYGVIKGAVGLSNSTESPHPEDGDFLGPAIFPWANKIIFTINAQTLQGLSENTMPIFVDGVATGSEYVDLIRSHIFTIKQTDYSESPTTTLSTNAGSGYLMWAQLFQALPEDKKIQIVSDILLSLSNDLSLTSTDYTLASGKSLKVGKNYIDFNGVRLYVSNEVPSVYTLLSSEPLDWSTDYTNYYTYDSVTNTYSAIPNQSSAPTFVLDTYYEKSLDDTVPNGSIGIGWTTAS